MRRTLWDSCGHSSCLDIPESRVFHVVEDCSFDATHLENRSLRVSPRGRVECVAVSPGPTQ